MPTPLEHVRKKLCAIESLTASYCIPTLWLPPHTYAGVRRLQHPAAYYRAIIEQILSLPERSLRPPRRQKELFYLAPVRYLTAWDHCGTGEISYAVSPDGWRQTGSLLKTIALLPYLQSLGVTWLLLLPPTDHGRTRMKGTLGSPYAPRGHTTIEETLAEPILELDAETQMAALVEACHRVGIGVVVELALRVASLDCPLIAQHPEWFYWVRVDAPQPLSPPSFDAETLATIERAVSNGTFDALPEPDEGYRSLFTEPPVEVWSNSDGTFCGHTADGTLVCVPNAFADYPPNDTQPLWTDITYFRLHNHPAYSYIAYNTIRYFASQLNGWENRPLWDHLASIAPSFIERFDVDGILLDMGHAFPRALLERIVTCARSAKPSLLLIAESFDRNDPIATQLGFDAVVGDCWHHAHSIEAFRRYAASLSAPSALRFFATPDTHNTPRIATRGFNVAAYAYALCTQLPGGIPMITCGSEFGECVPINTGLDFRPEEMAAYPPERLPLFSGCTLSWDVPDVRLLSYVRSLHAQDGR